jgi:putative peptide zinc metalloprotease protein
LKCALRPWVRVVVTAWVLLVVPLLLASAAVTVIALPRIIGTTWHSISLQAGLLTARACR